MTTHGHTADGPAITDAMVQAWADEAERGYDVDRVAGAAPTRRPTEAGIGRHLGVSAARPDLRRDLLARAEADHISVSERIRTAVRQYLHAS